MVRVYLFLCYWRRSKASIVLIRIVYFVFTIFYKNYTVLSYISYFVRERVKFDYLLYKTRNEDWRKLTFGNQMLPGSLCAIYKFDYTFSGRLKYCNIFRNSIDIGEYFFHQMSAIKKNSARFRYLNVTTFNYFSLISNFSSDLYVYRTTLKRFVNISRPDI